MVIEGIIKVSKARKRPLIIFFLGFLYSSVAILLSLWIFPSSPSLPAVFLTTFASIPLMINLLRSEEKVGSLGIKLGIYKKHNDIFLVFLFLFLGFLVSYTVWFILLPETYQQMLFSEQLYTIRAINLKVSGRVVFGSLFWIILINNLKVLGFCVLFSFIYGSGAIFILTWNASVISTAIGHLVRFEIGKIAEATHLDKIATYFKTIPIGFARYLTHGIFEISAYFLGGIAGGLISAAIVRHRWNSPEFNEVMRDSINLIIFACFVLILAAIIEISISPMIKL